MKATVKQIKKLVREAKVKASADYMRKEKVREAIQAMVASQIGSGDVNDQEALARYFADIDMAAEALKQIPFEVWTKLAKAS